MWDGTFRAATPLITGWFMVPPTIKNSVWSRHGRIVVGDCAMEALRRSCRRPRAERRWNGQAWSDIHFGAVKPLIFGRLYTPQTTIQALQVEKCRKYS